jgi:hypothetical protein
MTCFIVTPSSDFSLPFGFAVFLQILVFLFLATKNVLDLHFSFSRNGHNLQPGAKMASAAFGTRKRSEQPTADSASRSAWCSGVLFVLPGSRSPGSVADHANRV